MKVRQFFCATILAALVPFIISAMTWKEIEVEYSGKAEVITADNGDLILKYTNAVSMAGSESGTLTLKDTVQARLLVVGGGGSGSSGGSSTNAKTGYGGKGGAVVANETLVLSGGTYTISVGQGGVSATATGTSRISGKQGVKSSFSGPGLDEPMEAAGGDAGGGSAATGTGTESSIPVKSTGTVTFGKDGATKSSTGKGTAGGANTGNGGQGGYNRAASGAGGSGVVVVRLTGVYKNVDVTLKDMTLGVGEEIVDFAEQTTGAAVDIIYSDVVSTSFNREDVARGERTKEGRFALVGSYQGVTTAKIIIRNEQKKTQTTYTAKVTVTPPIYLKDLSIQRGETTASLVPEGSATPIDLDYDSVKSLKSSVPEIADFVKLPNGKIGVVGKVTGVVELSIITPGQSYALKVTVEQLLSGLYKAGAYDVTVSNASDVSYVDGDLVLIYRNVDVAVKKSFELPKATKGRLLAVGGGGAGGQDAKQGYNANYGLPGGGGAGGLVINDEQAFEAKTYDVSVGAGGAAVERTQTTIDKVNTWVPASYGAGKNGAASTVKQGTSAIVTAKGGGGGGRQSVGNGGGSGGGGSYSGGSKNGGTGTSGQGYAGGKGGNSRYGAGGGGAGGKGGDTSAAEYSTDPTNKNVDGSGAGGPGMKCDITGEDLEYARGGAGGVPRVYPYYYFKRGVTYYTKNKRLFVHDCGWMFAA